MKTSRVDELVSLHHKMYPLWDWKDHATEYLEIARELETELNIAIEQRDEFEAKFEDAETESDEYCERAEKAEERIGELKDEVFDLEKEIKSLRKEIEVLEETISELEASK